MRYSSMANVVLILAALALFGACRPPVDGCTPGEERCAGGAGGVPQVCLGDDKSNSRWTNADRPCRDHDPVNGQTVVCCRTHSDYANRDLTTCVPQNACLPVADAGRDAGVAE